MTATQVAPAGDIPQTDRPSDRDLLARYRTGDRGAAEELVDRTYGRVHGLLVRLSGDADLAADLTQEPYRRAWRSLDRFDGRASVATWLHRIAHNTFLNHRRDNRRIVQLDTERAEAVASTAPGPDDAAVTLLFYCNFASTHCMYLKRRIDDIGRNYPRQLRLVFYPMVPDSYEGDDLRDVLLLHRGALCADHQGAFWRFYHAAYDVLFERRRRASRTLSASSHLDIITSRLDTKRFSRAIFILLLIIGSMLIVDAARGWLSAYLSSS